jgi:uncharacterized repeat protein (TIGR03803 family)
MKVKSILTTGGLPLALTAQSAFGLSSFVSLIPNGSIASCSTCHTSGFGFNPFGRDFHNNHRVWNASLASLDSDGDGLTNGQELGDPGGTGTPTPGAPVTNPGDPSSEPAPARPPSTTIKNFGSLTRLTGFNPQAPLVQGPDGTLYGTAVYGDGYGTVFKIQPDGTEFTIVKHFINSIEGAHPFGGLVLSGGTLYGTTYQGGSSAKGTVFKVNTDGTGYSVLKSFTGSDGANPTAGLVMFGGALYGTTFAGGSSDEGTVFRIDLPGETNPAILTVDGKGSLSNGFGFTLSVMTGQSVVIEASMNLTSWTQLLTNSLSTGYFQFHDPDSTNYVQRFTGRG